ncbi:nitrite reductase small subunit [Aeromonas hydrophila]|nr:nitrite reductase small subunit [Aeromonas hydrophila]
MMKLACQLNDILPGTGVCALIESRQNMPVSLDVEVQS